jgi:predicted HicB family RNase H-like nuclease
MVRRGLKVKQLNIQIEDDQHEWLRQKAFRERVSMAQVVREIINKSMKEESEYERRRGKEK